MKKVAVLSLAAILTVGPLAGCQTPPTHEQTGRVMGGIMGGIIGSQVGKGKGRTAAIIAGTMAGSYIGGAAGRNMDEADRMKATQTLEYNRSNQPSTWTNPDTNSTYTVTPTRTYQASSGQYCREYTTEAIIGGKRETVYGTACRQPDGSWQTAN